MTGKGDPRFDDGHFYRIENAAVDLVLPSLGTTAFSVYSYLCRWAIKQPECFRSVDLIAADTSLSVRTVQGCLRKLQAHNAVEAVQRPGRSTIYRLPPLRRGAADCTRPDEGVQPFAPRGAKNCAEGVQPVAPIRRLLENDTFETTQEEGAAHAQADVDEFFVAWNEAADAQGFTPATRTPSRERAVAKRLRDPHFARHWQAALDRVAMSPYCGGCGRDGFKADLEWFLAADRVVRILEGKYDRVFGEQRGQRRPRQSYATYDPNAGADDPTFGKM